MKISHRIIHRAKDQTMKKAIDSQLLDALQQYISSGIEEQMYYDKYYLYSIITHSTAIEGSTVTEVENQLLFEEGLSARGRSLSEQMMNLDLRDAYIWGFDWLKTHSPYTVELLCQLSAKVMRRTGSEYSTMAGAFDSSQGDLRLCNVTAGVGGRSYMSYLKVKGALSDFCAWLNRSIAEIDRNDIVACYRLSFEAHFRLVTIHPWVDGNGRTVRLLMNIVQRQLGLVPSIITKDSKAEYIQALIDSREQEDSRIFQDWMMIHHMSNISKRVQEYQHSL